MGGAVHGLPRKYASRSRREAVERVDAYLRAHIDDPVPVSTLCRMVGLSERGLRDAFYSVKGMGPKRWIVTVRLHGVRHALTHSQGVPTTVTHAAAEYGFYELGRFAALYREAFGETPSDTLRFANQEHAASVQETRTTRCLPLHDR